MNLEKKLKSAVVAGIEKLYNQKPDEKRINFQKTSKDFEGDITIVVFPFTGISKKSLEQTANNIGAYLKENLAEVESYNVVKGFLNLVISSSFWLEFFNAASVTEPFGFAPANTGKTMMVEYASPNTNKPLHLGHIRNILLGYSVAEILKANGHKVLKVQVINDRGIHICKSMLAWQKWGNGETPETSGLWGGLIILGRAPISASANEIQIEGIPTTDMNGLYGGSIANDNSGIIKYVSIRHGGANIGNGNEINGLTLGGVGNGTIIENVEIVGNQDDGVEFFGGTVNVKNLLVWNSGDDAVDVDQSWGGTLDNFIVICGQATDHALEIDGPEGLYLASQVVKNGSIKGNPSAELGDFRSCPRGSYENIFFFNFPDPATTSGRGDLSISNPTTSSNPTCSTDNLSSGVLTFSNLQVILPSNVLLTSVFKDGTSNSATSVITRTVGATRINYNWTWAEQANELSEY
jgi:hypothetical protein